MASRSYEIAFRLGAKMNKSYGNAFNAAEEIAKKAAGAIKKSIIAIGATALSVDAVTDAVDKAIRFESAMADVAKVVDGLKDKTGKVTDAYAVMSDEILDMTARLPMAADEITQLIAAAGQSGIAADELIRFAEDAAKMGVAFDLSAEKAGEMAAVIRSSLGLSQDEFVTLADKVNYFGNTTTQSADKLIQVVQEAGLIGQQAGVSADQIAAMSAAMNGMDAENMSTALSNIYGALMTGSGATSAAASAWESLGFTSEQVAKDMLADSEGTMLKVFEAMKKLPKDQLASTTAAIFGNNKSTKMAVASFTENLDALQQNFRSIGDAEKYAGSMQNEFNTRAATTENTIKLAENAIDRLKISLGTLLLPVVAKGANLFSEALSSVNERIPQVVDNVKSLVGSIKTSLKLDDIFANLKPKLPAIKESAKYFATNFTSGLGEFLKGDSLSSALSKSMLGLKGILSQTFGGNGDMVFSALESGLERISSFIEIIRTNVGEVAAAFSESFGGISESIGPALESISGAFNGIKSTELSIFSTILSGIKDILVAAAPAIAIFVTMLVGAAGDILPVVSQIYGSVLQIVDMIVPVLTGIFDDIMSNAGFVIDGIAVFIDTLASVISSAIDTIMEYLPSIMPIFEQLGTPIGGLLKNIGETLEILSPLFASVFDFIIKNIIPIAMTAFRNLGNIIGVVVDVIAAYLPIIANVLMIVWEAIQPMLQGIMDSFNTVFNLISGVVSIAVESIREAISGVTKVFDGIIEFVTGIFTGNWQQAWQGVQDIFSGTFEALGGLIKAPLNVVISLINGAIDGINGINIAIPDWVPGIGGKNFGVNIPKLPILAKGSDSSPDTFIAGERGPELITNAEGSKVFTALETGSILDNLNKVIPAEKVSNVTNNTSNATDNLYTSIANTSNITDNLYTARNNTHNVTNSTNNITDNLYTTNNMGVVELGNIFDRLLARYDNLIGSGNQDDSIMRQPENSYSHFSTETPISITYNINIPPGNENNSSLRKQLNEAMAINKDEIIQLIRDVVSSDRDREIRLSNA